MGVAYSVVAAPFFLQAGDGIRYLTVTGVQTCALPILSRFCARDSPLRSVIWPRGALTSLMFQRRAARSQTAMANRSRKIGSATIWRSISLRRLIFPDRKSVV